MIYFIASFVCYSNWKFKCKQLASVYFNYALGLCLLNFTCHKAKSETVSAWHSVVVKLIWHENPGNLERNIEGNICE